MLNLAISEGVAAVILNRAPANAINRDWVHQFNKILDRLDKSDEWNVLHIRSALRLFSAGADIKEMREAFAGNGDMSSLVKAVRDYQLLFDRIEALPQITIAEINGTATGGGFELALACDLRIVADEVQVGLPELRLGLLPGAGGTQRLTRLCGRATAFRIISGMELVDGKAAVALGMAQWNAPLADLPAVASAIVKRYAQAPRDASRLAKRCINLALPPMSHEGQELEFSGSETLLCSEQTKMSIRKFLAERETRSVTGKNP